MQIQGVLSLAVSLCCILLAASATCADGEKKLSGQNDVLCVFSHQGSIYIVEQRDSLEVRRITRTGDESWKTVWKATLPVSAPSRPNVVQGAVWDKSNIVLVVKDSKWSWWAYQPESERWSCGLIDNPSMISCVEITTGAGDSMRCRFLVPGGEPMKTVVYNNDCLRIGSLELDTGYEWAFDEQGVGQAITGPRGERNASRGE